MDSTGKFVRPFLVQLTLVALLLTCARAQTPPGGANHFAADGLSFDYPAGWALFDKSDTQTQRLVLMREGGSALIEVIAERDPVSVSDKRRADKQVLWQPYAEDLARRLGVKKSPPWQQEQCPPFGARPGVGVRMTGKSEGRQSTGEVYTMIAGSRYVNVLFFREDRDEAEAGAAWKTVLETLKADGAGAGGKELAMGAVVNGKALKKPAPEYPDEAKTAGAQGVVVVKITVDEQGDVTGAHAVSGHPLLREAAEHAALKAKYSATTLCGHPVKVSAVISYTFVP